VRAEVQGRVAVLGGDAAWLPVGRRPSSVSWPMTPPSEEVARLRVGGPAARDRVLTKPVTPAEVEARPLVARDESATSRIDLADLHRPAGTPGVHCRADLAKLELRRVGRGGDGATRLPRRREAVRAGVIAAFDALRPGPSTATGTAHRGADEASQASPPSALNHGEVLHPLVRPGANYRSGASSAVPRS
jgi:hypothetical protein